MVKIWSNYLGDNPTCISFSTYNPVYTLSVFINDQIVTGSLNDMLQFWDSFDGKKIKHEYFGENKVISLLASLPNGDLIVGTNDGNLIILKSLDYKSAFHVYKIRKILFGYFI
jgi:WD40 repeat protein